MALDKYGRIQRHRLTQWGSDGYGHELIAYGNTSGKYMKWDAAANTFKVNGANVKGFMPVVVPLGKVVATANFCVFIAPAAGYLNQCKIVNKNAIAKNDTNYWTVALVDKGAAGAGTDKIAEKTTKATGGTAFAAYTAWDIGALSSTHKVLAAGDVVCLTLTKSNSAGDLEETACMLEFVYT